MFKDFILVEVFLSAFHHNHNADLVNLVTNDFTYQSNGTAALNFKQFIEYGNKRFSNTNMQIHNIDSDNGRLFIVKFSLDIKNVAKNYKSQLSGAALITVTGSLVEKVKVIYKAKQTGVEIISRIKQIEI